MPTVNSTAGADSAASSARCRLSGAVVATVGTAAAALFLRDQRVEALVGVGAGLMDGLLLEDQILHRLADEFARFRIRDDRIADLGRALFGQHVERVLPFLAH